jgi:hypothetical protein
MKNEPLKDAGFYTSIFLFMVIHYIVVKFIDNPFMSQLCLIRTRWPLDPPNLSLYLQTIYSQLTLYNLAPSYS